MSGGEGYLLGFCHAGLIGCLVIVWLSRHNRLSARGRVFEAYTRGLCDATPSSPATPDARSAIGEDGR